MHWSKKHCLNSEHSVGEQLYSRKIAALSKPMLHGAMDEASTLYKKQSVPTDTLYPKLTAGTKTLAKGKR